MPVRHLRRKFCPYAAKLVGFDVVNEYHFKHGMWSVNNILSRKEAGLQFTSLLRRPRSEVGVVVMIAVILEFGDGYG